MVQISRRVFGTGALASGLIIRSVSAQEPRRGGTIVATWGGGEPQACYVPSGGGSSPTFSSSKLFERLGNRKMGNVLLTLTLLAGVTAIDVLGAQAVTVRHKRRGGTRTQYSDRSGFPQGLAKARGAARDFRPQQPPAPRLAQVSG